MTSNLRLIGSALLVVLMTSIDARSQDNTKAEIEKLRAEIAKLREEIKSLKDLLRYSQDAGPTFRGKSAQFWLDQLNDADPKFRREAIQAIGSLGERNRALVQQKKLIPLLIDVLKENDNQHPPIAGYASSALAKIGVDALPALIGVAEDKTPKNENARLAAMEAIASLGPLAKPAVPALVPALKETDDVARRARWALSRIGPDARAAIPALVDALDLLVRDLAKAAPPFPLNRVDDGNNIVSTLVSIEPKIADMLPKTKQAVPGAVGPPAGAGGGGPGGDGGRLLTFHEAERDWRKAIDALKKKYPLPK